MLSSSAKKIEHRLRFDKVTGSYKVGTFLRHSVVVGVEPNCGIEQRAPPIFGRAAITLGNGHISS